jgi:DNA-binding transcriptional MocR family regulator
MLMRNAAQPLSEQLAERIAQRIRDRLLSAGTRLPSVRLCAQQQGVSPTTVVSAYDQLQAQGLVQARRNRGFYVRESPLPRPGTGQDVSAPASGGQRSPLNATTLIRGIFLGVSEKPQPGLGVLPPDWLQTPFLAGAVRRNCSAASLNALSLRYGEPAGDLGLRRALSARLTRINVPAGPQQIVTTIGATQALDVVSRTLLRSGDFVMVEEPGWAIEFARLDALGMRILPVPRRVDGPDLEVIARYCQVHSPRLFVSVSVLHNPTGFCLSPGHAFRLLELARQYDFHIVEDDTYSHFAPDHAIRLCALDGLQRTIYVGGFAKILAPNWRVGYLAAPATLVERLIDTKLLTTLTTPALLEKALAWCIEQGQLRRHAQRIGQRLDEARARTVKLALAHDCTFAASPVGLFGWVDTGVDTDALSQRMLDEGYLLAPGALFHAARKPGSLMRINFATTQNAAFWKTFARLRNEL